MKTVLLKIFILFTVLALTDARDYGTHINAQANAQSSPSRKVIRKEGDLPLFTYPVTGSVQALLTSDDATFNAFAKNVRSDLESLLRDYDIQNKDVLIQLLSHKLDLQMLSGEDSEALKTCEQMRSLFDQPDLKAAGILTDLTLLHARMVTGQSSGAQFQAEYEKNFRSLVESLPWNVVSERIKNRKAKFEKLSMEYVRERVETEIEPYLGKNHALDFPMATRLIYWRGELLNEVPQRQIVLDILSAYMKEHDALGPPAAPIRPVTDDYYGTKIVDNYRYMENLKDPEVQQWMKKQADYTRAVLDSLPGRAALLARINDLMQMQQAIVSDVQIVAGHYYSQRTTSGSQVAGLYVRDALSGRDRLLIDPEKDSGSRGTHSSISFYAPSPDNHYVVYGLSAGGSENAVLRVLEVASGKDTGETIDRARYAHPSWRDGRSFFYTQLQRVTPNTPDAERYQKSVSRLHVVGTDPNSDSTMLGFGVDPIIQLTPEEIPTVYAAPGTNYAVAVIRRGDEQARRVFAAPLGEATGPDTHWKPIAANYDDGIIAWKPASAGALPTHGDTLYMISRRDNPNGEIVSFDLSKPDLATPITILSGGKLPIEAIQTANDALYVKVVDGGVHRLVRIAFAGAGRTPSVTLPFPASVLEVSSDPTAGGAVFSTGSWTSPQTYLRVEPNAELASDAGLKPASSVDNTDDLEAREVNVKSWDGAEIPLSIIFKRGLVLDGSHTAELLGYGAYGEPTTPSYARRNLAAFERGVIVAHAHVRGGGDYGEAWHLAGYKLTKPNTWRDFIACAEYLIAHHYTSPSKLFGFGTSAGGILIGRAIEERPDLFAAAIAGVPAADMLRWETTANGEGNTTEFGSVKTHEGFEDLYAMSPYAHVRDGGNYPAVMVMTAINDKRVEPWIPAKFAARLQAATASGKPVLLRVDYDSGHAGIGSTRSQLAESFADIISFALWQTGDPDFQPKKNPDSVALSLPATHGADSDRLVGLLKDVPELPVERIELEIHPSLTFQKISAMSTDKHGNIYIIHRPSNGDPIVVLDPEGKFIRSWGKGMFTMPHGIRIDPDGNVWTLDAHTSTIDKFTPEGKKLLEISVGGVPDSTLAFCGATDIAFAKSGHIFVSDGYCNARVIEYDAMGKKLGEWGKHGSGPGEFKLVHSIAMSPNGTLYVADRENGRIEWFDQSGKFLGQWQYGGHLYSVALSTAGDLYAGVLAMNTSVDNAFNIIKIDVASGKILGKIAARSHELAVTPDGTLLPATLDSHLILLRPRENPQPRYRVQINFTRDLRGGMSQ